jgi:ATP-binding cassette subfamily C protein
VALTLTLIVMLNTSWLVTVLAVIVLPIFPDTARQGSPLLAALRREAADHNSAMSTQMTERFSAPGATLVKLFGRPDEEAEEFRVRAAVFETSGPDRDAAVRLLCTGLVSILALSALVCRLGGFLASGPAEYR